MNNTNQDIGRLYQQRLMNDALYCHFLHCGYSNSKARFKADQYSFLV